jgi:hypothetical protein
MRVIGAARNGLERRWNFNGSPRKLLIAASAMVVLTVAGLAVERFLSEWYGGAPAVALVAIIASRLGMRSALLAAVIGIATTDYFFIHAWGLDWPRSLGELGIYLSMLAAAVFVARPAPPPAAAVFDRGPDLPFTSRQNGDNGNPGPTLHGNAWRYWDVQPSGSWTDDCQVGAEYLRIWLNRARSRESHPLLPWVVHDMIRGQRWSGVEAGFASALERAVVTTQSASGPESPIPQSQD